MDRKKPQLLTWCALLMLSGLAGCEKTPAPVNLTPPDSVFRDYPVIDVHGHISPAAYSVLPEIMSANRLVRIVNLSGGYGEEALLQHPPTIQKFKGNVALFANMDWSGIDSPGFGEVRAQELKQAVRQGFAGLKISKALGLGVRTADGALLRVDDARLDPIWKAAGDLGIPVSIHTSDPKAFFEPISPMNERFEELSEAPNWSFHGEEWPSRDALLAARDRVVERHPNTVFILVHAANNPEDIEYVDRLMQKFPNVRVDTAARIGELGRHPAGRMKKFFEDHAERVLFGTDIQLMARRAPKGLALRITLGSLSKTEPKLEDVADFYQDHWDYFETSGAPIAHPVPIQGRWKVNPVGLDQETLDQIYWKNAERDVFAPHLGRAAAFQVLESMGLN